MQQFSGYRITKVLFNKFDQMLSDDGVIAVQIPKFQDLAVWQIIDSVSRKDRWKNVTAGCSDLFTYHDSHFYYDILSDKMNQIDMWETDYIHIMQSHQSIIDWIKSTGMKPYLDRISDENDKSDFEKEVLYEVERAYQKQKDGKVLFPFKRLFFTGYR